MEILRIYLFINNEKKIYKITFQQIYMEKYFLNNNQIKIFKFIII